MNAGLRKCSTRGGVRKEYMCGRHFLVLFAYWFCECFHTLQYSDNLATFYIDFCVYLFLCIYAACLLLPFIVHRFSLLPIVLKLFSVLISVLCAA